VDVELFEPTSQPLETPDDLLTVKDEEVQVPRILNDAELADAQVLERQAEERRKLAELDDPRERGLVDMMDGKLEGKGLEEIWQDLPEPGWMTQIPSEAWTDAQKFTAEKCVGVACCRLLLHHGLLSNIVTCNSAYTT
jgi:hypothetical protein